MGILKNAKGNGHLSAEEESDEEEDGTADQEMDRELVQPVASTSVHSINLTETKAAPSPFNASGSLGVVVVAPSKPTVDATSARPPVPPADIKVAVGSGLKAGVVMTIVKRGATKKGIRSALGQQMMSKVRYFLSLNLSFSLTHATTHCIGKGQGDY